MNDKFLIINTELLKNVIHITRRMLLNDFVEHLQQLNDSFEEVTKNFEKMSVADEVRVMLKLAIKLKEFNDIIERERELFKH